MLWFEIVRDSEAISEWHRRSDPEAFGLHPRDGVDGSGDPAETPAAPSDAVRRLDPAAAVGWRFDPASPVTAADEPLTASDQPHEPAETGGTPNRARRRRLRPVTSLAVAATILTVGFGAALLPRSTDVVRPVVAADLAGDPGADAGGSAFDRSSLGEALGLRRLGVGARSEDRAPSSASDARAEAAAAAAGSQGGRTVSTLSGALGAAQVAADVAGRLNGPPGTLGAGGIPVTVLAAYHRAEALLRASDPSCHLPWWLLAGIGKVESGHASGGRVDASGTTRGTILGVVLDGSVAGTSVIRDSDGGALDGDPVYDRAVGPMQFLPGTWQRWGRDGNGDGRADPNNVYDAALTAGAYLCAGSRDLSTSSGIAAAVLSYNNSQAYLDAVLAYGVAYRDGVTPVLDSSGTIAPPPVVPPSSPTSTPTSSTPSPTSIPPRTTPPPTTTKTPTPPTSAPTSSPPRSSTSTSSTTSTTTTTPPATAPDLVPDTSSGPADTEQSVRPLANDRPTDASTLDPATLTLLDAHGAAVTSVTVDGGTYTLRTSGAGPTIVFVPSNGFTGVAPPVTYRVATTAGVTGTSTYQATVEPGAGPTGS